MSDKRKELCFRLECEHGFGIYQNPSVPTPPIGGETNHPCPYEDRLLAEPWRELMEKSEYLSYYFGFSSMAQVRQWCWSESWLRYAQKLGVRISIYQTSDYYIGDTQMIFRKSTATLVGKTDLI